MGRKHILLFLLLLILLALTAWVIRSNFAIQTTTFTLAQDHIPAGFSGFRIVQLSDLHNRVFGRNNGKLMEKIEACNPDIIIITGDLVDSYHPEPEVSLAFAEECTKLAPIFYVSGNHEARLSLYPQFRVMLEELGVTVLENQAHLLSRGGSDLALVGLADYGIYVDPAYPQAYVTDTLASIMPRETGYTILLAHRPEHFPVYSKMGADLVFSGHAHGGQFRLPLIGGLFAPGQGLFPKYDSGLYVDGSATMIVSRGLGNSTLPVRFNNYPEIILTVLESTGP